MTQEQLLISAVGIVGVTFCAWMMYMWYSTLKMGLYKDFKNAEGIWETTGLGLLVLGTPVVFGYLLYNNLVLVWKIWN